MYKLLAVILCILPGIVYSQAVDYTLLPSVVGAPTPLQNLYQNQGIPLNLGDDSTTNSINLGFEFTFYDQQFTSTRISNNGVIGFQGAINGCCSGYNLEAPGNNYGIFALQTDLINIQTANPWYKLEGNEGSRTFTVGWYNMPVFADANYRSSFEITLFEGTNNIFLNYADINAGGRFFTAGLKGSDGQYEILYSGTSDLFLENNSFTYSYNPPPPPIPEFLYWNSLTNEGGTYTLTEPGVVRYGASGVYAYASLEAGTYSCSNGFFGDPIPGVYKSCELGSNELPVVQVNCEQYPTDPECIINALTDPENIANDIIDDILADIDEEPITDQEEEIILQEDEEEPILVVEDTNTIETIDDEIDNIDQETNDEEDNETTVVAANETQTIREIANEEKASALSDNISTNVLELALSVAESAVSTSVVATPTESNSISSSSTRTSTVSSVSTSEETKQETREEIVEVQVASVDVVTDVLETGRQLNRESQANTQQQNELSASESLLQAETIAMFSSESVINDIKIEIANIAVEETENKNVETKTNTDVVVSNQTVVNEKVETVEQTETQIVRQVVDDIDVTPTEILADTEVKTEDTIEITTETVVEQVANVETKTEENTIETDTVIETNDTTESVVVVAQTIVTETIAEDKIETVIEETIENDNQTIIVENIETVDSFSEIMNIDIRPNVETKDTDVEFVQQLLAQTEQKSVEEDSSQSIDEKVTIQYDPNLANAFNVIPNTTNLEILGVLNNKQEEKSDAEKRAEQVVAANKEQQEEINKNYMDADQSGIVAAISADTDVSSYRSAMLNDNNIWYKPEDIYKNVVYKDNVRGSYFLEKGNTDTYKKMVEEQYK